MSTYRQRIARVANSGDEEPGARDVQARICGGLGWATTQVYPAQLSPDTNYPPRMPSRRRFWSWPGALARYAGGSRQSARKVPPALRHQVNAGGFFHPMADAPIAMNRDQNPLAR